MGNRPTPPGFKGLREDLPLVVYDRLLPHWRQEGATYFVTFRLGDSLPKGKLHELRGLRDEWERHHPPPRSKPELEEIAKKLFERVERWLDLGFGSCLLRSPQCAAEVVRQLHAADGDDYELGSYAIMPNHVHVITRPLKPIERPLEHIVGSWKGASAYILNQSRNSGGPLWQQESYDRIIRDDEHLYQVIQYIGRNPRRAGIAPGKTPIWIRPEWHDLGWRFEEENAID